MISRRKFLIGTGAGAGLLAASGLIRFGDRLRGILSLNEIPSVPLPTFEITSSDGRRDKPEGLSVPQEEFIPIAEAYTRTFESQYQGEYLSLLAQTNDWRRSAITMQFISAAMMHLATSHPTIAQYIAAQRINPNSGQTSVDFINKFRVR